MVKRCVKCKKSLPDSSFKERSLRGEIVLTTRCISCLERAKDYQKSPKGLETRKRRNEKLANRTDEERKEANDKKMKAYYAYAHLKVKKRMKTETFREKRKVYRQLDHVQKSTTKYNRCSLRAAVLARHKMTRKWEKNRERAKHSLATALSQARARQRRKQDPGRKLLHNIRNRIARCFKNQDVDEKSISFSYTEFASSDDVIAHFESCFKPGMRMHNYGWFWSIAHKIPSFWYDYSNPEDIRRANSKSNLGCDYEVRTPSGELTNGQKNITLPPDDELLLQGESSWPTSWNGRIPDATFRSEKMSMVNRKSKTRLVGSHLTVQSRIGHFFQAV